MSTEGDRPPRVGIFVTCIVDAMRPNIGFASLKLLKDAGCDVDVPTAQTCCGQPAFNSGDDATTRRIAEQVIEAFEDYDYIVVPSGSCAVNSEVWPGVRWTGTQPWTWREGSTVEPTSCRSGSTTTRR